MSAVQIAGRVKKIETSSFGYGDKTRVGYSVQLDTDFGWLMFHIESGKGPTAPLLNDLVVVDILFEEAEDDPS